MSSKIMPSYYPQPKSNFINKNVFSSNLGEDKTLVLKVKYSYNTGTGKFRKLQYRFLCGDTGIPDFTIEKIYFKDKDILLRFYQ